MLITLARSGELLSMTEPLREGLNVRGVVRGRINPATFEVEPWRPEPSEWASAEDRDGAYTHGNASLWRVHAGRLVYAAPDLAGVQDVLYAAAGDGCSRLSDDFLELAAVCENLDLDLDAVAYFVTHGYFRGNATFFRQIRRVPAGTRWVTRDDGFRIEPLFETVFAETRRVPRTYEAFGRILASVCRAEAPDARDAILLSGGWDSGLLAAQMRKVSTEAFHSVTFQYVPEKDSNQTDAQVAGEVSAHLGLRHRFVSMNLLDVPASRLDPLVARMPLSAHMAAIVLEGTRPLRAAGIERAWCGQNADSIYNLGPTSRLGPGQGKIDFIKRIYLSKPFFETLADVEGGGFGIGAMRAVATLGAQLAGRHFRDQTFRIPRNFNELLSAFRATENYLCLLSADCPPQSPLETRLGTIEVRERLFDEKLSSFLVGRDPRVMHYGPIENGLDPIRPFASPAMLLFFRGLELGWRDVIGPKRFIHARIQALFGKRTFQHIYGSRRPEPAGKKTVAWQQDLFQRACVCREMRAVAEALPAPWRDYAAAGKVQYITSLYWLSRVLQKLGRTAGS